MTAPPRTRRLVTFGVGDTWYAADIAQVERVLRREGVQPVPNMPPWMDGVIEYQGRIVPVVDLRRRFAMADVPTEGGESPDGGGGRLLVLSVGDDVLAAAVDRVVDVRAIGEGDIAPPPRFVRGITGEFLAGMVRRETGMVLLLDVARLLSPDEHRVFGHSHPDASAGVVAAAGPTTDA